jgi:hypothetical protein
MNLFLMPSQVQLVWIFNDTKNKFKDSGDNHTNINQNMHVENLDTKMIRLHKFKDLNINLGIGNVLYST